MAKIVIGNVKGKDGRGISKIIKTSSTGTVDTYTITYTDSTTSTFTINNADNISLQRQIVPSAAVESSTTASQAYTAGDYVVVGGVLRKVKSSIAKGSTIGDSNSTSTTVTGEIETVRDSVSHMPRLFTGSKVLSSADDSCVLFSRDEFLRLFGRAFNRDTDVVMAMNGDGIGIPVHVEGCTYLSNTGAIYANFDRKWDKAIRINYAVALAGK
ncbi:MAG: hypothetical protein [Bacteriophage sp.]|nr:MAG: hypothetical protein [Bacteriophage sp.]